MLSEAYEFQIQNLGKRLSEKIILKLKLMSNNIQYLKLIIITFKQ